MLRHTGGGEPATHNVGEGADKMWCSVSRGEGAGQTSARSSGQGATPALPTASSGSLLSAHHDPHTAPGPYHWGSISCVLAGKDNRKFSQRRLKIHSLAILVLISFMT